MNRIITRPARAGFPLLPLVVLLFWAGAAPAGADGAARCRQISATESAAAIRASNDARQDHGLAPLSPDPRLARAAAAHACDMARRGQMTHRGSTTSGPGARAAAQDYASGVIAENIAAGNLSGAQVQAAWMRSRGHRRNILHPKIRDFGIGRALGADGRTVYWSAVYAAPR